MNGRNFARQRGIILHRSRSDRHAAKAMAHLVRESGARAVFRSGKLVGYRLPDGFMACEKRRYRDEAAAREELANVGAFAHLQPNRVPVRAYHCPYCRGWHVTSKARASE